MFRFLTASAVLATTLFFGSPAHAQTPGNAKPQAYSLGAGDSLGRAVFNRYVAVVRARQNHAPALAAQPAPIRWTILVNTGDRILRVQGTDGNPRPTVHVDPLPNADPLRVAVLANAV